MLNALLVVKVKCRMPLKRDAMGKQASQPVPKKAEHKAKKALELLYSGILGPFEVVSLGGSKYAVTFIDEYTVAVVKYMNQKSQVLDKVQKICSGEWNTEDITYR